MSEAVVRIAGDPGPSFVRINGQHPNFMLGTDAVEAKALHELDPVLLDLMEIASTVFAADGAIPRGGPTRPHMGEDWYRQIDFEIPVRCTELWQRDDVSTALREAVETLTGDSVRFEFTRFKADPVGKRYLDLNPAGASFEANEVVLFSGGLDSFAGALELLATTATRVVLVTHRSAQKVIPRQVDLGRYLAEKFPGRVLHVHVLARRTNQVARDSTQRSRTLLFSALGEAVACALGARRLSFFENGIVSHNLPLSPQIVGTMATRTTHPLALRNINRLMQLILPGAAAPIGNGFQWLTKSEVVSRISEYGAATQIVRAVSCTSIREQDTLHTHCGACTQCFDRRFAILHAGLSKYDPDDSYATDILFGERLSNRSITMAVEWTRHALRLGELDEQGFMERFGPELSRILRGHPDLPRTVLDLALNMHQRQSTVVREVLETVLHERAPDLVAGCLPSTSLVRLHLGSGDDFKVPQYQRDREERSSINDGVVVEEDDVSEPGASLRVVFSMSGSRHVVDVMGLATVIGAPARVPHALKPVFDEDKRNRVAPKDHQFRVGTTLPDLADATKESIRKDVERCRRQLARGYEQLHGQPPQAPLLIQSSRSSKGYRLDPHIVVIPPTQET